MMDSFSEDEIDRIARRAGLPLTPEWRAALLEGSPFVTQITAHLRRAREPSAEPAQIFVAPQPQSR